MLAMLRHGRREPRTFDTAGVVLAIVAFLSLLVHAGTDWVEWSSRVVETDRALDMARAGLDASRWPVLYAGFEYRFAADEAARFGRLVVLLSGLILPLLLLLRACAWIGQRRGPAPGSGRDPRRWDTAGLLSAVAVLVLVCVAVWPDWLEWRERATELDVFVQALGSGTGDLTVSAMDLRLDHRRLVTAVARQHEFVLVASVAALAVLGLCRDRAMAGLRGTGAGAA